jgi:hypothetical protein
MRSKQLAKTIFFSIIVAIAFGAVTTQIIFSPNHLYNEFEAHLKIAADMEALHEIRAPHFLFHAAAIVVHGILRQIVDGSGNPGNGHIVDNGWIVSCIFIMALTYFLSFYILYKYLIKSGIDDNLSIFLSVSLLIVAPIFILSIFDGRYYFGYLSPTIYNIPTQSLLKLMTIAVFVFSPCLAARLVPTKNLVLMSLLVVLNGLSKPNFLIIMLPALVVLSIWRVWRRQELNFSPVLCMACAAILVLSWQYYFKFINPDGRIYESSITLTAPFEVWNHLTGFVSLKFILSVVFPLCVLLFYWESVVVEVEMQYAWLIYIFGAFFSAFVAETGMYRYAGNFIWSGEIGVFVLFVASVRFVFLLPMNCKKCFKYRLSVLLFAMHVLCGVIYYVRSFVYQAW